MPRTKQPSPYQPLVDYLASSTADEVTLTVRELTALIGRPLPEGAILYTDWWTSASKRPATLVRALGWRARADRDHLRVVFTRVTDEE